MRPAAVACSSLAFAFAVLAPSLSFALDSMDAAIGNSVVITAGGKTTAIYYNADGTYSTSGGEKGSWTLDGKTLCTAPTGAGKSCIQIPAGKKVGDKWEEKDAAGNVTATEIRKGRPKLPESGLDSQN